MSEGERVRRNTNLSCEQEMAAPVDAGQPAADWGLANLALEPGAVEASRRARPPRLEELPATASTMFEPAAVLEAIHGTNDLQPAWWLEEGAARARAVCKIETSGVDYSGEPGSWSGTGFLVAPGILCTNHHVLNSRAVAENGRALFDYAALADGGLRPVSTFRLRPDRLFWTTPIVRADGSGGLDATFVAVEGDPGAAFGHMPLLRQSFAVGDNDKLNIVQHPDGRLKEVALRDNQVTWQNGQLVHYRSDTEPGSSGAPVFNDIWELVALHHAAADDMSNEGIKFSALATLLEQDAQNGDASARELLKLFKGSDELMGFFGSLGRRTNPADGGLERVVDAYEGEQQDLDLGFWNIEWFNQRWRQKLDDVARIVVEMNLDVWVFVESSLEATEALVQHLADEYDLPDWKALASEEAANELQITTVMWNSRTVDVTAKAWPDKVHRWFKVNSRDFDDLNLEAVHGKVFDRYPALFEVSVRFESQGEDEAPARFNLVPVHLKAKDEGSLRRRMASRLLAAAVAELAEDPGFDTDWIIGGDANTSLASGDLDPLAEAGLRPLTAKDALANEITYVKAPFRSLIDHVFVSPNLKPSDDDFAIVALDRTLDRFLTISDHRPILLRLTAGALGVAAPAEEGAEEGAQLTPEERERLLRGLRPSPAAPAAERPYYDAQADAEARDRYWQGVAPADADFTARVGEVLRRTHGQPRSYQPSRWVYPWVDLRPNGMVRSIYSGVEATPEAFIAADLEADRRRAEARSALMERGLLESTALEARLEAEFAYNCEHVVPQSWFEKREPMRGDLHHLFACEPRCNSFRSNFPLVQHELERTMQDCGRVEEETFEPKGGKGAVARATLYFMLRYPSVIGRRYAGQRLQTLIGWHEASPPDEWERHRNVAIQEIQGNRNPLIDFPDWARTLAFAG